MPPKKRPSVSCENGTIIRGEGNLSRAHHSAAQDNMDEAMVPCSSLPKVLESTSLQYFVPKNKTKRVLVLAATHPTCPLCPIQCRTNALGVCVTATNTATIASSIRTRQEVTKIQWNQWKTEPPGGSSRPGTSHAHGVLRSFDWRNARTCCCVPWARARERKMRSVCVSCCCCCRWSTLAALAEITLSGFGLPFFWGKPLRGPRRDWRTRNESAATGSVHWWRRKLAGILAKKGTGNRALWLLKRKCWYALCLRSDIFWK